MQTLDFSLSHFITARHIRLWLSYGREGPVPLESGWSLATLSPTQHISPSILHQLTAAFPHPSEELQELMCVILARVTTAA